MTDVTGAAPEPWFVRRLYAHTGGNPFFAREVVHAVEAGSPVGVDPWSAVPAGVRDVLRQRLGGQPDPTREALAAAAVLGMEVELVEPEAGSWGSRRTPSFRRSVRLWRAGSWWRPDSPGRALSRSLMS